MKLAARAGCHHLARDVIPFFLRVLRFLRTREPVGVHAYMCEDEDVRRVCLAGFARRRAADYSRMMRRTPRAER